MRNKRGSVLIALGMLLILSSGGLSAYNLGDAYFAQQSAQEALEAFEFLREPAAELAAAIPDTSAAPVSIIEKPTAFSTALPPAEDDTLSTENPVKAEETERPPQMEEALPDHAEPSASPVQPQPSSVPALYFPTIDYEEIKIPDYILNPHMKMPVVEKDGQAYIGVLEIPSLDLTLPVISEWNYARLKKAPCRYAGSAYTDNLVISAHNYKAHFGRIKELDRGSLVAFTDADGNRFEYQVVLKETLSPGDVKEMKSGEFDLSLFTCTVGGSHRVTVRCDRIR